ncbi:hypothetical protein F5Y14DRAFT_205269 [Nemania sp. NC0429]|nr:hypothetical protein F5Y14DRAFT_205269 [Nemania sp. NC0429]
MATEQLQEQPQQPAGVTVLGRPREPQALSLSPSPTPPGDLPAAEGPDPSSQPIEFRGFDFFARRDFNEFKDASRAYFAEKNDAPSSWLGDATPPASAHSSLDESRPAPAQLSYQSSDKEPKKDKKILGLRRQWFWTILAIIVVVIIVAVGVGVGVSTSRAASSAKSAGVVGPLSNDTSTTTTPTPTHGGPSTQTSSTHRPTGTPGAVKKECPEINGTVYDVPGSTKKFLQLCAVDSGKQDGAIDIRNVYTETADDCMDNCAGTVGCTGCGWGFIKGDRGPPYRCWLKTNVNHKSHYANASWHFAVLL